MKKEDIQKHSDSYVMEVSEFIELVKQGYFIDYDGIGYFHDGESETDVPARCDVRYLESYEDTYPYVCWYGR